MKQIIHTAVLALAVAAGCGGPAHKYDAVVTGTVTIDGELANSGTITFHPVGEGKVAIGRIHPDGSYSLRTGQGNLQEVDGGTVESGEYIITVSITGPPAPGSQVAEGGPPVPGPSLVAAKYASKESSDLKRVVAPGRQIVILDLEPAVAVAADEVEQGEEDDKTTATSEKAPATTTSGTVEQSELNGERESTIRGEATTP